MHGVTIGPLQAPSTSTYGQETQILSLASACFILGTRRRSPLGYRATVVSWTTPAPRGSHRLDRVRIVFVCLPPNREAGSRGVAVSVVRFTGPATLQQVEDDYLAARDWLGRW